MHASLPGSTCHAHKQRGFTLDAVRAQTCLRRLKPSFRFTLFTQLTYYKRIVNADVDTDITDKSSNHSFEPPAGCNILVCIL
jgi:hypothetical protein